MDCIKCQNFKTFDRFYKKHSGKGYRPKCKDCCNHEIKERKERKEKGLPSLSELRNNKPLPNKKQCNECLKILNIEEFHKIGAIKNGKGRKAKCKNCCKKQLENWRNNNKNHETQYRKQPEIKKRMNENTKKFRKDNQKEKYISRLRSETCIIIKSIRDGKLKESRCKKIFGCSCKFITQWIESQFTPWMSWKNYGTYWNIDHIKPCSLFNYPEEFSLCSHWTNIIPIEIKKNSEKYNKYSKYIQLMQEIRVKVFMINCKKVKNVTMDNPQPSS